MMEDKRTPEQLFHARREDIGKMVASLLNAACGATPAFMLVVAFLGDVDTGEDVAGMSLGNVGPESMKILARNLIEGMQPQSQGAH